ncbi:hypothetical protein ACF063_05820 [Streptomyces chartreusis]|uniref:hypothetical protein n=1 Tax=Streptomyces chartreusis TaxID=1969 RepID=UPI0036F9019F
MDEQGPDGGEDLWGEAGNEVERHDEGDVFAFLRSVTGDMLDVFHVRQQGGGLTVSVLVQQERCLGQDEIQDGRQGLVRLC